MSMFRYCLLAASVTTLFLATIARGWTDGNGWGSMSRDLYVANLWDYLSNRNYRGVNNSLTWPGGWDLSNGYPYDVQLRNLANYHGFVIGAKDVPEPCFPDSVWPYMVGQRDGWNDGELGDAIPPTPPNMNNPGYTTQILFRGRLARTTYRQAFPVVTVDGVADNPHLLHYGPDNPPSGWIGYPGDGDYQYDVIDPNMAADAMVETAPATRLGITNARVVYAFVDRRNDDYLFWHWSMVNNGIWGRMLADHVYDLWGQPDTVRQAMLSIMWQWDRSSRGCVLTNSAGADNNDTIWNYYGVDYDGAQTEDMRLVWVRDGDQDPSRFAGYSNGSQDDYGDPDPVTGELLSARDAGMLLLHFDRAANDRRDDAGQPLTCGWVQYANIIHTGGGPNGSTQGMQAKYDQMRYGLQDIHGGYYKGEYQTTPLRGTNPRGGSWIKASNDPAVSGTYWPGKVLGVDTAVTDVEQQFGLGPRDIPPGDSINGIWVMGVNGLDLSTCLREGKKWLAGEITDAQKDSLVFSAKDSLFATMRQAKAVYESAQFPDGHDGMRYASTREELETAFGEAITADRLALSPPAPASLTVSTQTTIHAVELSWTLNTTTGSDIAGWRVYRAVGSYKSDSLFTLIAELPPDSTGYRDTGVQYNVPYYYYLTTFDAAGHESWMFCRTATPAVPWFDAVRFTDRPDRTELSQNAPNPFNPSTSVRFSIENAMRVTLALYDVNGRIVRTLVDERLEAGLHEVVWDGHDATGRYAASGVYICRLAAGSRVLVRRMTLIR